MPTGVYPHKKGIKKPGSGIYPRTEKHRNAISLAMKGRKLSESWKRKIGLSNSISLKGNKISNETKKKISLSLKGRFTGSKSWNWKGGISKEGYPLIFNKLLKLKVRKKYKFVCFLCKRTEEEEIKEFNKALCVNHIDFNKSNCDENNLNLLCLRCNIKINKERNYWTKYFQEVSEYVK